MKGSRIAAVIVCAFVLAVGSAYAWHGDGYVFCDNNENGVIDNADTPLAGVVVTIVSPATGWMGQGTTDENGYYYIQLPDEPDSFVETLDPATLPADASYIIPASGEHLFATNPIDAADHFDWLIASETCVLGQCWMTAGGVKFEPVVDQDLAQHGPKDTFGGNVFPGCSPDAGQGGQWNHVAHTLKLHFQGFSVQTVHCGNVPGIDPGSESPVTPYNFIEFQGMGRLKGIQGNKVNYEGVYFFGRVEDRNEPGSNGADDGEEIDRYFLRVFTDLGDPEGSTLLLVDDGEGNPLAITGGNLQLHFSSCDDPPTF